MHSTEPEPESRASVERPQQQTTSCMWRMCASCRFEQCRVQHACCVCWRSCVQWWSSYLFCGWFYQRGNDEVHVDTPATPTRVQFHDIARSRTLPANETMSLYDDQSSGESQTHVADAHLDLKDPRYANQFRGSIRMAR